MSRKFIPVRMGVGIVPGRQCRFFLRVMGRVGIRVIHGVVSFLFFITLLILAGL
jgi:hypothetical protein